MTIVAKFPSQCSACGKRINRGEKIEWTKGRRDVRHTDCRHAGQTTNDRDPGLVDLDRMYEDSCAELTREY